jgi:hypothetical protein
LLFPPGLEARRSFAGPSTSSIDLSASCTIAAPCLSARRHPDVRTKNVSRCLVAGSDRSLGVEEPLSTADATIFYFGAGTGVPPPD